MRVFVFLNYCMGLFNSLTEVGDVGRRKSIVIPRFEVGDVFIKKKEVGGAFTTVSHMKVGNASTAVSHYRNHVYYSI